MANYSREAIQHLSKRLDVDHEFFVQCVEESVIEIQEIEGELGLAGGATLRLRRVQRLCDLFEVDVPIAHRLLLSAQRIAELENELRLLKSRLSF